jgi:hypothetical protein
MTTNREEAIAAARENRERFERLADSDLPYAPYAERVLRLIDDHDT